MDSHGKCQIPRLVLLALLLPTLAGCATYSPVRERYTLPRTQLVVNLPAGWLHYTPAHDGLVMTRDGLRLERIRIAVKRFGARVPNTDRVYQAGMLPLEAAELTLGLMTNTESIKNFETARIELAQVANCEGYRAEASFVDEQGLPARVRLYGVMLPEAVAEFEFVGEDSAYFDRYVDVFERLVASASLIQR